jgi:hypothetical protein
MLARVLRVAVVVLIGVAYAAPSQADWLIDDFFFSVVRDVKRRQCWPKPFVCEDQASVHAPFVVMVANGWQRQNTLGDFHFDPQSGELTEAGRLKVQWIVQEAPEFHRDIYVHRGPSAEQTAARINAVQQAAVPLAQPGQQPQVIATEIPARGWSAEEVDVVHRKFLKTIPDPRLPQISSGSGGGSAGATAQ